MVGTRVGCVAQVLLVEDDPEIRRALIRALTELGHVVSSSPAGIPALEAILARHAAGQPGCVVTVNGRHGGLVLQAPGQAEPVVLYPQRV